jgi:transposase
MFLKKQTRKKDGKNHIYWELVESYRTARGPRHRTVAYLGELEETGREGWANLCRTLDGKPLGEIQPGLFDEERKTSEPVPENVSVDIRGVRVESAKDFGDVYLALILWRTLGLDELFGKLMSGGKEAIKWPLIAAMLVIARFLRPSSELNISNTWYPRTVLPEVLGITPEKVYTQRLYRALDALHPYKEEIEKHLTSRLGELFEVKHDILLYDITSTYFEGEAKKNPQAKRGYSRDKRFDCKQVCIGLVVTEDGLPLAYEVFDGNRVDVTTIEEIVEAMEKKYGEANRVWVLDRGMVSEDNLEFIRERGGSYLVGTPRSMLRKFERELTESGWAEVYEDLEVKLCPSPEGDETFVLCRSASRTEKEKAMHERFSKRIETGLDKLGKRLEKAKRRPIRSRVERQIGRLLQKNSRAAGKYEIHVEDDPDREGHLKLTWNSREEWSNWATLSEGAYLLRTNMNEKSPEKLWKTYIQLTDAEAAFRTIKSDLAIRPIYHQTEKRVQAHILVAFLAYAMWKTLQKWMEQSGLGRGVRTVLEEFARIKCCEVVLPTSSGKEISLRCITKPDGHQQALLVLDF